MKSLWQRKFTFFSPSLFFFFFTNNVIPGNEINFVLQVIKIWSIVHTGCFVACCFQWGEEETCRLALGCNDFIWMYGIFKLISNKSVLIRFGNIPILLITILSANFSRFPNCYIPERCSEINCFESFERFDYVRVFRNCAPCFSRELV